MLWCISMLDQETLTRSDDPLIFHTNIIKDWMSNPMLYGIKQIIGVQVQSWRTVISLYLRAKLLPLAPISSPWIQRKLMRSGQLHSKVAFPNRRYGTLLLRVEEPEHLEWPFEVSAPFSIHYNIGSIKILNENCVPISKSSFDCSNLTSLEAFSLSYFNQVVQSNCTNYSEGTFEDAVGWVMVSVGCETKFTA